MEVPKHPKVLKALDGLPGHAIDWTTRPMLDENAITTLFNGSSPPILAGLAMDTIVGDDGNVFCLYPLIAMPNGTKHSIAETHARRKFEARLTWELLILQNYDEENILTFTIEELLSMLVGFDNVRPSDTNAIVAHWDKIYDIWKNYLVMPINYRNISSRLERAYRQYRFFSPIIRDLRRVMNNSSLL
ncbi:hypothetical protein KC726_00015 [Candidatus Woesebacteria bacterium]|nr:hypothetical protein [Candidatus Woesebacteria bacterium]